MKQKLIPKLSFRIFRRWVNFVTAVLLLGIAVAPIFDQTASAFGQVQSRFIEMSDSTPSGTGVTYNVSFIPTSNATVGGIVVDFCNDSPITFSSSCTFPAGFTLGTTVSVSGISGIGTGGSWVTTNSLQCGAAASNFQTLLLTNGTAQTPTYTGGTVPINFQITGVTNPSATGSFYARIYTFDTALHTTNGYTCSSGTTRQLLSSTAGLQDYGGAALSTASQIAITATVEETLTFCVSGSSITGTCGSLTSPSLTIGTGSPPVLTTAGQGTPAYTQVTTNALHGISVRMKATNACTNGGLTVSPPDSSGGCGNIPGIGSSAAILSAGTWGMCVAPGAGVTVDANYKDTTNSCPTTFNATSEYGMNGTNLTGTYGDEVYHSGGALNGVSSSLTFAAMAANTTPAGVYQGNEILIATGTY